MLAAGAPNACNACHLDRSLGWMADELRVQHDVAIDPAVARTLERDTPAGEHWLRAREPDIRVFAAMAATRVPRFGRFALPVLADNLRDPLPYVRTWTQIAVEQILGRRLAASEYDARARAAQRDNQATRLRAAWQRR